MVAFCCLVSGRWANVLFDTGGGKRPAYVSETWVRRHGSVKLTKVEPYTLRSVLGGEVTNDKVCTLSINFGTLKKTVENVHMAPLQYYDLILGPEWIGANVESTDWQTGTWKLKGREIWDKKGKRAPRCKIHPFRPASSPIKPN